MWMEGFVISKMLYHCFFCFPLKTGTLHMYKNRLQQYAQKRNLSLPNYTCESEGPPHTRRFKSRVSFDGKSYETMKFFPTLKEAEHAVAMVACQMLQIDKSQEASTETNNKYSVIFLLCLLIFCCC